jgi:sugar phosphate isomerase/epimerase
VSGVSHSQGLRIGFRTAGFASWPIERALRALAEIGYGSVELCLEHRETRPGDMTPARCREVAALLRDLGLRLSSVSYHGDRRPAQEQAESHLLAGEVAERLECPVLVLNTTRREPGREAEQMGEAVALARRLLERGRREVLLAYEPEPGLVIGGTAQVVEFMRRVGSPRVRVNLDVGHAHITERSAMHAIATLGSAIVHTHIEDIAGKVHHHLVVGDGELDFAALRRAFEAAGYGGAYTVDLFDLGDDQQEAAQRCFAGMLRWFG